jgi:hypothetical protein
MGGGRRHQVVRAPEDNVGRRYGASRMVARRAHRCTPSGREVTLVVLDGSVIAPEAAHREPGLGWLEAEGHQRLSAEAARRLEDSIDGLRIGCWPYRAPIERWNEAAELHPCLALAASGDGDTIYNVGSIEPLMPRRDDATAIRDNRRAVETRRSIANRLRTGSQAVAELFLGVREALRLVVTGLALAACTYYLLGCASWLWKLRDGMTAGETQGGVALIVAALLCWAITQLLGRPAPARATQHRQPVTHTCLGVYRAGITLQLSALLGFIIW